MVSRYATCGLPTLASTWNSRFKPVHDYLQVQFTHSRDDCLPGLIVGMHPKRGIFLRQFTQSHTHFFLVRPGFRLNCDGNDGIRKFYPFQDDGLTRGAQGITRRDVLKAHCGGDIPRPDLVYFFP